MIKNFTLKVLSITICILLLTSCKKENKSVTQEFNDETSIQSEETAEIKTYSIKGENIFLREGPGTKFNKLVNKKAAQALGETSYLQVDYSCTVEIIEENKDGWVKIRVINPSHLSSTHIGWIPLKSIIKEDTNVTKIDLSKLNYKIISTTENNVSKNYNIFLNEKNLSKDDISSFINQFREKNCSSCTINIFDTEDIKNLIDKYPLKGTEYIKFADHFVATSTFDSPKMVNFYPFQDLQYKEYGGVNFKK